MPNSTASTQQVCTSLVLVIVVLVTTAKRRPQDHGLHANAAINSTVNRAILQKYMRSV
jgi:hypothetical protein